ncbi:MAG: DUF2752 domain-containing protein [bacterium]|nr:DUF2752 domain-containing protein [bacterium]
MLEKLEILFRLPCAFRRLTGYYCPGCGGTRAFRALLHGRIRESLYYHPLVLYMAIVFALCAASYLFARLRGKKSAFVVHMWMIYVGVGITALNFFIKNAILYVYGIPLL